jgi:hypothetical protein
MRWLSATGLCLAGTYTAFTASAVGCAFLGWLGCDPECGLALMPLLPAFLVLQPLGVASLSLMTTPAYFSAIFATAVALYIFGWLLASMTAALKRRLSA